MSSVKEQLERANYAIEFRRDAKRDPNAVNGNGRNIVSHRSLAEVQAPPVTQSIIDLEDEKGFD